MAAFLLAPTPAYLPAVQVVRVQLGWLEVPVRFVRMTVAFRSFPPCGLTLGLASEWLPLWI